MSAAPAPDMLRTAICALLVACSFEPQEINTGDDPPGPTACEANTHACGTDCVPDRANTPDVGCASGCDGACPSVANSIAGCAADGTCTLQCMPGFADVGGACIPNACEQAGFTCGAFVDDANNSFDCGGCEDGVTCGTDHACAIGPDDQEPNDSIAAARDLGDFNDVDNETLDLDNLSIGNGDEDWFRFHITDGFDGGNPIALIQARRPSPSSLLSDHELTVWFACDSMNANTVAECGEASTIRDTNSQNHPTLGRGCSVNARQVIWAQIQPNCTSAADSGTITIRIRKLDTPRGDRYLLRSTVQ